MAKRLALTHLGYALGAAGVAGQTVEQRDRLVARDAVGGQAGVRLELGERARSRRAEDAVDSARVEAEQAETALELSDVIATLHRSAEVEESIAELVAGLDDRGPGLVIADAGDLEPTRHLECSYRDLGRGPVLAVFDPTGVEPGSCQSALEVAYCLAGCAEAEGQAVYRNSPSSCRSWPLPFAPTRRFLA